MNAYSAIRRAMQSQVWMVQPERLEAIAAFLHMKAEGKVADAETLAAIHGAAEIQAARAQKVKASSAGAVAVLPVYGLIMHRASSMGDLSSGPMTSTVKLLDQFKQAANDPNISAIVLDIDSPGGTVEGVDELASLIREARGSKQVIAVSNKLCASAAYYIASACSEIVASPSSQTGSIGVYAAHEDDSKYLENEGIKVTLIKFGENKAEGNPYEPLSDKARAHMQDSVDEFGAMFEKAVAKGRKVSQATVHDTFGQGRVFSAAKALKLGMVDMVGTLDDVMARFGIGATTQRTSMETTNASERSEIRQMLNAVDQWPCCGQFDECPGCPDAVKMKSMARELELAEAGA